MAIASSIFANMGELQEKVRSWLKDSDRDHFDGIGLLSQVTANRMLIRNLSRIDNKYNKEKLFNELKRFSYSRGKITTTNKEAIPVVSINESTDVDTNNEQLPIWINDPGETAVIDDPKAVEELEIALSRMHNKKGLLSNSLKDFADGDNEGRKRVIDQVADINNSMASIRGKLNFFQKNGKLPPVEEEAKSAFIEKEIPDSKIEMKQFLLNERSSLSKLRRKFINPKTKTEILPELEARMQSKTTLINEVERRLHG